MDVKDNTQSSLSHRNPTNDSHWKKRRLETQSRQTTRHLACTVDSSVSILWERFQANREYRAQCGVTVVFIYATRRSCLVIVKLDKSSKHGGICHWKTSHEIRDKNGQKVLQRNFKTLNCGPSGRRGSTSAVMNTVKQRGVGVGVWPRLQTWTLNSVLSRRLLTWRPSLWAKLGHDCTLTQLHS